MISHYSSLLHKGRIAFVTVSLLVWAYVPGLRPSGTNFTIDLQGHFMAGVASIASIASLFVMLPSLMEIAYYKRYFSVVQSGIYLEKQLAIQGYFRGFTSAFLWSFLAFNFAVSPGLFLIATWLWLPIFKVNSFYSNSINALLVVLWGWPTLALYFSARNLIAQQKNIANESQNTAHFLQAPLSNPTRSATAHIDCVAAHVAPHALTSRRHK